MRVPEKFIVFVFVCTGIVSPSLAQLRSTPSFDRDGLTLTFASTPITPFRTVANSPYSGTQTMETVQTLADGTRLTRGGQMDTPTWRDSLGRLRTERPAMTVPPKSPPVMMIEIDDPVGGYSYVLDGQSHIAHRLELKAVVQPPMPATMPQRPASTHTLPNGVVAENVPLGTKTISGVETFGMRITMTYPPGSQLGNDRPVSNVSESWYSTRLGMVVLGKYSNPGGGDSTTTLKDLKLTEPSPDLFRVPADYKIVDETGPFSIKVPR